MFKIEHFELYIYFVDNDKTTNLEFTNPDFFFTKFGSERILFEDQNKQKKC